MTSTITMQTILPRFWKHWTLRPGNASTIFSLEMTAEFSPISMNRRLICMSWDLTGGSRSGKMDAVEAVDILENLDPEEKALIAHGSGIWDDIHLIFSYDEEQIGIGR